MRARTVRRQSLRLDWLKNLGATSRNQRIAAVSLALLLLCMFVAWFVLEASALREQIAATQQASDRRNITARTTVDQAGSQAKTKQTIAQHNQLVEALEALEKVPSDGIVIESVSLNPEGKTYRVELRTGDVEAAKRYVDKLNSLDSPSYRWYIVSLEARQQSIEWLAVLEAK